MYFAANLGLLFTDVPFLARFDRAAAAGFEAVEFPWPEDDLDDVVDAVRAAEVRVIQFNAHAGDLAAGDRGYANDPKRVAAWRSAVDEALHLGHALGLPPINLLVGNRLPDVPDELQHRVLLDNLAWAVRRAEDDGCRFLIEVLNDRDTPDYLVTRVADGAALVEHFARPELRLQFDSYHVAVMEPDLVAAFHAVAHLVGHVQLADAPGRHEPGTGHADLRGLFDALTESGYRGAVSLEYLPIAGTEAGLGWLPPALRSGRMFDPSVLRL